MCIRDRGNLVKEQKMAASKEQQRALGERGISEREGVMDRLLQSVNTVKNVLQTNLELRQQALDLEKKLHQANAELYHLQTENEELKEKMRIFENVNKEEHTLLNINAAQLKAAANKMQGRMTVATELFKLKKDNSLLEQRLKNLERENISIRVSSNMRQHLSEDNFEPVRSVVSVPKLSHSRQLLSNRRRANRRYKRREEKGGRENYSLNMLRTAYEQTNELHLSSGSVQRIRERVGNRRSDKVKWGNSANTRKSSEANRNKYTILKSEEMKRDSMNMSKEGNSLLSNTHEAKLLYQTNINKLPYRRTARQGKIMSFISSKKNSILASINDANEE
eukprot:TRINITY_DN15714_c0_g1_i1.p1 TRINITY_DN15714_c0_g1~~TRINITY_DN15714_c0_g1_i1.p1  ORF type:complete len:336 (+),score=82.19 TRINITY_DN15714_c0_g1_i1:75-1082(+)